MSKLALIPLALCMASCAGAPSVPQAPSGLAVTPAVTPTVTPVVSPAPVPARLSGLDLDGFDRSVRPQDDLFRFSSGSWLARTDIPADRSNYGTFTVLEERAQGAVRSLVEAAAADQTRPFGSDAQKVGDFYADFMDVDRIATLGATPLAAEFTRILALRTPRDVFAYMGHGQRIGVPHPLMLYVGQDARDSTAYIASVYQSGLTMPDRDYYLVDDEKTVLDSLSEQLRSRFDVTFAISTSDDDDRDQTVARLAPWSEEVDGWCNYAADSGFDPLVIGWHRSTSGSTLYNWKPNANPAIRFADYRSWQTVSELCAAGLRDTDTLTAAIGREIAVKFSAFAALAAELPLPSAVLADPDNAPVPASPSACYFISAALPQAITKPAQVAAFLRYVDRLPRTYTALAARDLHRRHGAALLARSNDWNLWFAANNALFA